MAPKVAPLRLRRANLREWEVAVSGRIWDVLDSDELSLEEKHYALLTLVEAAVMRAPLTPDWRAYAEAENRWLK